MTADVQWFEDNASLAPVLAAAIARDLREKLAWRDTVSLAVSGGRSPVPVFEALREEDLDWARVIVTLVDERWVPETDSASNAALVKTHLMQGRAATAIFIPLYTGEATAEEAERTLARRTHLLAPSLDVVILGMGDDGHTASLFPNSPNLDKGLALGSPASATLSYMAQTGAVAPVERMSLTLPWILEAGKIYLQFGGSAKIEVFNKASAAVSKTYPVSFVLTGNDVRHPVQVFASRN